MALEKLSGNDERSVRKNGWMCIDRLASLANSVNQPSDSAINAKISRHNKRLDNE